MNRERLIDALGIVGLLLAVYAVLGASTGDKFPVFALGTVFVVVSIGWGIWDHLHADDNHAGGPHG